MVQMREVTIQGDILIKTYKIQGESDKVSFKVY